MALIIDRMPKARSEGSGYERVLGDAQLAKLISATHATTIAAGSELEKLIMEKAPTIESLDAYLGLATPPDGVFLAQKRQIQKSVILGGTGSDPDFVIFEKNSREQKCRIVELKDGDQFDTKKAAGEWHSLNQFLVTISRKIQFKTSAHVCFFHATDRQAVVDGFKRKIEIEDALTGRELCAILGVDYDAITAFRKKHQFKNFDFFIREIWAVPSVRDRITSLFLSGSGSQ
jgi:hypothetical protein